MGIKEQSHDKSISVIDAASLLGMKKQTVFKVLKRLGVTTFKEKNSNHRGQAISYISLSDFELVSKDQVTSKNESADAVHRLPIISHGVFYLIQLEPDHDPGRFKLGFASNINERLRSHRCSAPFSVVVEKWPCHELWERTAIDSVTQGCDKLHTEVFRAKDINKVKVSCDEFFSLMPALDNIMR